MESQPCTATFNIMIPSDLEAFPYYLFTSTGIHTHPPPPPAKIPGEIADEISYIIRDMQNPDL
jgi:hypothetical protein